MNANTARNLLLAAIAIGVIATAVILGINNFGGEETVMKTVIQEEPEAAQATVRPSDNDPDAKNWKVEFGKEAGEQIRAWEKAIDQNRIGNSVSIKNGPPLEAFEDPEVLGDIGAKAIFGHFQKEMSEQILNGAKQFMKEYRKGKINSADDPSLEQLRMRVDPRLKEVAPESAQKLEEALATFFYDLRQKKYDKPVADEIAALEGLETELSDYFKQHAL